MDSKNQQLTRPTWTHLSHAMKLVPLLIHSHWQLYRMKIQSKKKQWLLSRQLETMKLRTRQRTRISALTKKATKWKDNGAVQPFSRTTWYPEQARKTPPKTPQTPEKFMTNYRKELHQHNCTVSAARKQTITQKKRIPRWRNQENHGKERTTEVWK